jgi:hypothetical protein
MAVTVIAITKHVGNIRIARYDGKRHTVDVHTSSNIPSVQYLYQNDRNGLLSVMDRLSPTKFFEDGARYAYMNAGVAVAGECQFRAI